MVCQFFLTLHARVTLYPFRRRFRLHVERKHPRGIWLNSFLKSEYLAKYYTKYDRLIYVWFPKHKLRGSKHTHSSKHTQTHWHTNSIYARSYAQTHTYTHTFISCIYRKKAATAVIRVGAVLTANRPAVYGPPCMETEDVIYLQTRRAVHTGPPCTRRGHAVHGDGGRPISLYTARPRRAWRRRMPYISIHGGPPCMEPRPKIMLTPGDPCLCVSLCVCVSTNLGRCWWKFDHITSTKNLDDAFLRF